MKAKEKKIIAVSMPMFMVEALEQEANREMLTMSALIRQRLAASLAAGGLQLSKQTEAARDER